MSKRRSSNNIFDGKSIAITGGCGYVGRRLAFQLLEQYPLIKSIKLLDVTISSTYYRDLEKRKIEDSAFDSQKIQTFKVDITDFEELVRITRGVDVLFHVASFGMSGKDMLSRPEIIWKVNVGGSENVVNVCIRNSIPYLIYTSTYNVVFGGNVIKGGGVDLPYFPIEKQVDEYSKSKTVAEQMIRKAHGKLLSDEKTQLRSIALRCAAIYGEYEERHFPRILDLMYRNLLVVSYGNKSAKTDWIHIDNLVHAHILAAKHLLSGSLAMVKRGELGLALYISDGQPLNSFEFLSDIARSISKPTPLVNIPYSVIYMVSYLIEILFRLFQFLYLPLFNPFLVRAEVNKIGVEHWFKLDETEKILGYKPKVASVEGRQRMYKWVKEDFSARQKVSRGTKN